MKSFSNSIPNLFDSGFCLLVKRLRGQDNCSITRVNTRIFNMLRDDEDFDLTILSHGIQFDLFDFPEEFRDRDRMLRRNCRCLLDILF